jgi:acid stress chaperone HdeB
MRRIKLTISGVLALLALSFASPSQAQVMIDMSKITCDQLLHGHQDSVVAIAMWLSGYYHAKRHTTIVDLNQFGNNADVVAQYCVNHPKMRVMAAIDKLAAEAAQKK